ncbi:hypothetical protein KSP35_23310 [Aquihabitans sp. G128]|uniref:hypothetical protein n=1 Tax=Aquihabitans sp. G128 TaxID=2849779 RepID=UPI001C24360B|nr:hypothetical protein [Aquihabitans sp. G128]QXC61202.1 hypothetical protein KSP35_23310 [Aquihabitans sp. G128]
MRLEQLVLYGPGDDERVRFGPGVTVFAGLGPVERADLVATVVDALTGRLSNASVVYTDHLDRRVFADRTGATYAATGTSAPGPAELLGKDPAVVADLLTVSAEDLGLGDHVSPADLQAELVIARAEADRLHDEHADFMQRARMVADWVAELAELDRRIDQSDADAARWAWIEKRRRLDEVRTELAMRDRDHDGRTDRQILEAVDALRTTGEQWADLAAATSELRRDLGPLPVVSATDLSRVAATPEELPEGITDRLASWQGALDDRRQADAERTQSLAPVPEPEDELVASFAAIDQARLWAVHSELAQATAAYEALASSLGREELDPQVEADIEAAHLEVVHRQREVERRFRPGMLGSAAFAVGSLLAGTSISILLGVVMLAASVAMGVWLVAVPRRQLAAANAVEETALSHADAGSWLGLHLRRLDAVTDVAERKRFEAAANARAGAQVDWDETVGALDAADLDARADAVRAHADAIDPQAVARRREAAEAAAEAATRHEVDVRHDLLATLEAYGMAQSGGDDLDPQQLLTILERRIQAGQVARRAKRLVLLSERESEAAKRLDDLLTHLGLTDGDLESRLDRAIQSVAAARQRQGLADSRREREDIEEEMKALVAHLEATARHDWNDVPEPTSAPIDPNLLEARRREVAELVAAAGQPDVVGAERRYDLGLAKVNELEARLDELAQGPASLQQRLISRLGRTTWIGDHEETVPVVLDDALTSLPVAEQLEQLDLLVRLAEHTQVVLLSADPVVSRWARDRSTHAAVTLYETEVQAADEYFTAEDQTPAFL